MPYKVHTVLTDHGIHFTTPSNTASAAPLIKEAMERGEIFRAHAFEYACAQNDVDHRLTKPRHPWTNGQVERMNRTIKEATVKRYYYESHDQLRKHLADFVCAYNFARRLKTLRGLTPYEYICKIWTPEPQRFRLNPLHRDGVFVHIQSDKDDRLIHDPSPMHEPQPQSTASARAGQEPVQGGLNSQQSLLRSDISNEF